MIYECIQNFSRGYTIYEEGTLWERIPDLKHIVLVNKKTGEWIIVSKTEFDLNFIKL